MFKVTKYPHGTFSWADCASTDAAAAKPFYTAVMGWAFQDIPMGDGQFYTMFMQDGESVAGLSQMGPEMAAQGVPAFWTSYVTVDDVDALAPRVAELGGTVLMPPMDVFDNGRMLLLQDPTGAQAALWQPKNHIGSGLVNTVGAMCWNELATPDAAKAGEFYGALLGWEVKKDDNMDYYYAVNQGRMNGGMMQMTEEWGDMPPHWMVYFTVADIDAALEQVRANGGAVHNEIDSPQVGRFAVITDPAGAALTLIQTNNPDPWEE